MKYIQVCRENPQNRDADPKYYLALKPLQQFTFDDLADRIVRRTSLTKGDVRNALSNIEKEIIFGLKQGFIIDLDKLGTMRLQIKSRGVEDLEAQPLVSLIKGVHVVLQLRKDTLDRLQNIKLEEFDPY